MLGVYHQHWINLRLDFDIDGPVNAAKECNVRPLPADPEANGRGRAFTVEHTVFGTEKEAERILDPAADRPWMIYKQDLVFWYSLGFTHITKPEDYPIMPAGRASVNFAPEGFFARSPALGHATLEVSR